LGNQARVIKRERYMQLIEVFFAPNRCAEMPFRQLTQQNRRVPPLTQAASRLGALIAVLLSALQHP
jgi:hypothetical protein